MKHIFIINKAAGKIDVTEKIKNLVSVLKKKYDCDYYCTTEPMDAARYVDTYMNDHQDEPTRFYACGGDGTLNEVVNGAVGHKNCEVGCYPCGSGDDFVKYYGGSKRFLNIESNMNGKSEKIDLLKIADRYSINAVHFGFDSYVARSVSQIRRKKIIGGKMSYITGVIYALFRGMKTKGIVYVDGNQLNEQQLLLCTVANGSYVGGSYKCAPRSKNNDGLMEVCLFKTLSIFKFIKLMKSYQEGTHLENKETKKYLKYMQGKSVRCTCENKNFYVSVDGELLKTNDFTVDIVPGAIDFVVPCK